MPDDTTLVVGFAREGTSAMMQMLHRAGVACENKDNGCVWPMFEDKRQTREAGSRWIDDYEGGAVKVLNPVKFMCKPGRYRVIHMSRRDHDAQVKSWRKLLLQQGEDIPEENLPKMREHLEWILPLIEDAACDLSTYEMLRVVFEDMLAKPRETAERVARFVGVPESQVEAMWRTVIQRPSDCLPDMLEEYLHEQGEGAAP